MNVENVLADVGNKKKSELQINWDGWENNATNHPHVAMNEKMSEREMSFIEFFI